MRYWIVYQQYDHESIETVYGHYYNFTLACKAKDKLQSGGYISFILDSWEDGV